MTNKKQRPHPMSLLPVEELEKERSQLLRRLEYARNNELPKNEVYWVLKDYPRYILMITEWIDAKTNEPHLSCGTEE